MMQITDTFLTYTHGRRVVRLEELELNYKVRALVQVGVSGDVARAFGFSDGELSTVKMLAKRRKLITG